MSRYRLVIFDLDGTLADTSPGIYECHRYTNLTLRGAAPTDSELNGVIGGPLLKTYKERFGYSDEDAARAVRIYREHYAQEGIKGTVMYPGIMELLSSLKRCGCKTAVATLKAESLAKTLLGELGAAEYLDVIHGVDANDTLTKADLLRKCMNELDCTPEESVLIGDSLHDANGACEAGVGFIACTYGFGFRPDTEPECEHIAAFGAAKEIERFLCG